MRLGRRLCLVVLAYFCSSIIVLNKCNKLDGYKFPVYSTPFCPRNDSEWNRRSSALKCNETNGYTCLPNDQLTELLEFCYTQPFIWIEEGVCLFLRKKGSNVDLYKCSSFFDGCPNAAYQSKRIFEYPTCISIGNGCFLAEPSCKSSSDVTNRPETSENVKDKWILAIFVIGTIFLVFCFLSCLLYLYRKRKFPSCKRCADEESILIELEERQSLITIPENKKNSSDDELQIERDVFNQWKQEDLFFITTRACEKVETVVKSRNLVIVAGHSGSGKSAIIQHIALKYREQGWNIIRVKEVKDISDECSSNRFQKNKTICVFNDSFGKEYFDDQLNNSWQKYEEEIKIYLNTAKLMMSCRKHIIYDTRLKPYLASSSNIVDIDDDKYRLSLDEKRQILQKYDKDLSDKDCDEIVKVEKYFPLLCKLYSSIEDKKNKGKDFFTKPVTVLKEEIYGFRNKDKGKYCALALLVLFNDKFCVSGLLENKDTKNKFKRTLELCGLQKNTPPSAIGDSLNSLMGFFVIKIGDTYHFKHDFVMEVTTHVFGTDYPAEIIKYSDIGFLRRGVKFRDCKENDDSCTIYLCDKRIKELGERLFTELFGERLLDVVLNPFLRNEKIIKELGKTIADHPENLERFLERKKLSIDKQKLDNTSRIVLLTKLSFMYLENQISPLFALIIFCHTQLSQYCFESLQKTKTEFISHFSAVCCNGAKELFYNYFKDKAKESLSQRWGGLFPVHIVSVFHNYELLNEMIKIGADVNQRMKEKGGWTPLILAAGNDPQEYGGSCHGESGEIRRNKTIELLLNNGADVNLCKENGVGPLFIACLKGHESTVQLLLSYGADINLCENDGESPLYIACRYVHDNIVQILLKEGADVDLCTGKGFNPVYLASERGQNSTLVLLLKYNPDINKICLFNGASPLHAACQSGYYDTVQLLLNHGADINICIKDEVSPLYIAFAWRQCEIVNILLERGADTGLCSGLNPTYLDLFNKHDSTITYLLQKDNIYNNLYDPDSYFSLFVFCHVECMSRALFKESGALKYY